MQPNTANTHHNTDPLAVPPELLEAVARALAAALIPPPRRPPPPETEQAADFLTAAQLARRLGVSRETVRRLAIAGALVARAGGFWSRQAVTAARAQARSAGLSSRNLTADSPGCC